MFNVYDWYWRADDGRIFASAREAIVDEQDETYLAWLRPNDAPMRGPTRWPSDAEGEQTDAALQEVLNQYGLYASLDALKAGLKAAIDEAAERERLKYITAGAGQVMEYQQAATEAAAFLAANHTSDPKPGTYPMLEASRGLDGETLTEVATVVSTMFAQWQAVGSAIRSARLAAKKAIDNAETVEAARTIVPNWPAP